MFPSHMFFLALDLFFPCSPLIRNQAFAEGLVVLLLRLTGKVVVVLINLTSCTNTEKKCTQALQDSSKLLKLGEY